MALNPKIIIPIAIVVVVVIALVALVALRPGGIGGGETTSQEGTGGGGGGAAGTETNTTVTTGPQGRAAILEIDQFTIPSVERRSEGDVLILEIRNIKVTGYGNLIGNASVTVNAARAGRTFIVNYSNKEISVQGTRYITLTVRIDDPSFASSVMQELRSLTIELYYKDPETGALRRTSVYWAGSDLFGSEGGGTETGPIRTRPGEGPII